MSHAMSHQMHHVFGVLPMSAKRDSSHRLRGSPTDSDTISTRVRFFGMGHPEFHFFQ